ncbi:MAG: hypothetical protein ABIJ45_12755 [Candidatus Zixiibacteriota bacterium]
MKQTEQTKYISFKGELLRKSTHFFAFAIPGSFYFLEIDRSLFLSILFPFTAFMIMIEVARLRGWRFWTLIKNLNEPFLRKSEIDGHNFSGATYILLTACAAALLFSKPVFLMCMSFIIFGDISAALIGRKFGKHKYRNKSLEGSLAFLVTCLIVGGLLPGLPYMVMIVGAVVATITEFLSFEIDDNTSVPLISGLAMTLLLKLFVF